MSRFAALEVPSTAGEARRDEPEALLGVSSSASQRRWHARLDEAGERAAGAIAQRTGASDLVSRILAGRGVTAEAASGYLAPSLRRDLPDPSTLADMDGAASRLAAACVAGERVAIFGDYDVDGATSSALLAGVLGSCGAVPRIYIPDRIFEGYGPNPEAIEMLVGEGARLVVCVDCGSTSAGPLAHAARLGAEVIVLDHHQVGADLPEALAVVNPNRADDLSGLGNLAAVGVAFLACVALVRELRRRGRGGVPDLLAFLDLVALGTVCDMVPLTGLNRALVVKGLVALRHSERPGLRALVEASRLKAPPDCGHLGFLLGPRINAGGRIGDASLGATLLTTSDRAEATRIAELLDRLNVERQAIEAECVADAMAEIETRTIDGDMPPLLLVAREGWHPGVVGLVASRLKERYDRPAIAVALDAEGGGTGSGRSVAGVDLGAAIRAAVAEGLLVKGGGHAMAAGLTLARGGLVALEAFLSARLAPQVEAAGPSRRLDIDGFVSAAGVTVDTIGEIDKAGPYGTGNPSPVFVLPAHRIVSAGIVGSGHVRVALSSGSGPALKAIAYRASETELGRLLLGAAGRPLHVAGTLCLDHWGGSPRPQLRIVDAAEASGRV